MQKNQILSVTPIYTPPLPVIQYETLDDFLDAVTGSPADWDDLIPEDPEAVTQYDPIYAAVITLPQDDGHELRYTVGTQLVTIDSARSGTPVMHAVFVPLETYTHNRASSRPVPRRAPLKKAAAAHSQITDSLEAGGYWLIKNAVVTLGNLPRVIAAWDQVTA